MVLLWNGLMKKLVLQVAGLDCSACARQLEQALCHCPGVEEAWVLVRAQRVRVRFDPLKVGLDALLSLVDDLGYPVISARCA